MSYQVPGYGFAEFFGAHEDDLLKRSELTVSDGTQSYHITGNRFAETFRDHKSDALFRYEDDSPAVLRNRFGKGQAILNGINLGLSYSGGQLIGDDFTGEDREASITTKKIVLQICREMGINPNICTVEDVKVTVVKHEAVLLVFLINSAAAPAAAASNCLRSAVTVKPCMATAGILSRHNSWNSLWIAINAQ